MSRAFVKEDVDPPERSGRRRSASGLPPGAANYITARGIARLQQKLTVLRSAGAPNAEKVAELERILSSVTIVESPRDSSDRGIAFGAKVTLCDSAGKEQIYAIVGVEELDLEPNAVSWISPVGRTLLNSKLGDRIELEDGWIAKIVKVEYPWED